MAQPSCQEASLNACLLADIFSKFSIFLCMISMFKTRFAVCWHAAKAKVPLQATRDLHQECCIVRYRTSFGIRFSSDHMLK
jgi:hypothetical protein